MHSFVFFRFAPQIDSKCKWLCPVWFSECQLRVDVPSAVMEQQLLL